MTPVTRAATRSSPRPTRLAGRGCRQVADASIARGDLSRCRSCPRSKPSPATFAGSSSVPGSAGVRVTWLKTLRSQDPEAFARAVVGRRDRRHVAAREARRPRARRRDRDHDPPQDDRPAVRAPQRPPGRSVRPARPGVRGRARAAVPGHPQVRAGRRRAAGTRRPATSRASSAGRRGSRASGRSRSTPAFTAAGLPEADPGAEGPPQAAPPRPGVHRRRRQHLRRRGALGVAAPPAPFGVVAAAGRRGPALPRAAPDPRGGGRAPRLVDRRLHGARRRRRDAGAPAGLPARRRALLPLRAADPADRHRGALDALLLVVPAAAVRRAGAARRRSCAAWSRSRAARDAGRDDR